MAIELKKINKEVIFLNAMEDKSKADPIVIVAACLSVAVAAFLPLGGAVTVAMTLTASSIYQGITIKKASKTDLFEKRFWESLIKTSFK